VRFCLSLSFARQARVIEGTKIWEDNAAERIQPFEAAGQDIVEQLIVGLGWRVTAEVSSYPLPESS